MPVKVSKLVNLSWASMYWYSLNRVNSILGDHCNYILFIICHESFCSMVHESHGERFKHTVNSSEKSPQVLLQDNPVSHPGLVLNADREPVPSQRLGRDRCMRG